MKKHYQIRKRVICDLVDGECTDEHDITTSIKPSCKECNYYKGWKLSGLNLEEYIKKYVLIYDEYKYR